MGEVVAMEADGVVERCSEDREDSVSGCSGGMRG